MIKTVDINGFSQSDYVATALEGSYGLDGRKNFYITCLKGLCFVNAVGPLTIDEKLPENMFDWHLIVCTDTGIRTVAVRNSHLSFTLAEGETAHGSFRLKA